MPHAIIRGENGRRHEVDFGDAPVRVEIYHSDETVEIFIEADFETIPEERRRFAVLNIPVQRSHCRGGATFCEPSSCTLDVLRNFDTPAELRPCLSAREGGPPVSPSRWSGIQARFADSIDRACRADDDFAPCG